MTNIASITVILLTLSFSSAIAEDEYRQDLVLHYTFDQRDGESILNELGEHHRGEPNQAIGVGHKSPACLFENVQVFGGHQ